MGVFFSKKSFSLAIFSLVVAGRNCLIKKKTGAGLGFAGRPDRMTGVGGVGVGGDCFVKYKVRSEK